MREPRRSLGVLLWSSGLGACVLGNHENQTRDKRSPRIGPAIRDRRDRFVAHDLGTMLGHAPGPGPWLAGLAAHLVIAGLIALIYGWGFETLSGRADWRVGLAFGPPTLS